MGVDKSVETKSLAKGSIELRRKMLKGDIKSISQQFKIPYTQIYNWITGKNYGDPSVLNCAKELAAYYDEIELTKTREQIINSYENTNKNRN